MDVLNRLLSITRKAFSKINHYEEVLTNTKTKKIVILALLVILTLGLFQLSTSFYVIQKYIHQTTSNEAFFPSNSFYEVLPSIVIGIGLAGLVTNLARRGKPINLSIFLVTLMYFLLSLVPVSSSYGLVTEQGINYRSSTFSQEIHYGWNDIEKVVLDYEYSDSRGGSLVLQYKIYFKDGEFLDIWNYDNFNKDAFADVVKINKEITKHKIEIEVPEFTHKAFKLMQKIYNKKELEEIIRIYNINPSSIES